MEDEALRYMFNIESDSTEDHVSSLRNPAEITASRAAATISAFMSFLSYKERITWRRPTSSAAGISTMGRFDILRKAIETLRIGCPGSISTNADQQLPVIAHIEPASSRRVASSATPIQIWRRGGPLVHLLSLSLSCLSGGGGGSTNDEWQSESYT